MTENTTPLRSHITVTASYLLELKEDAAMLAALRQSGVDISTLTEKEAIYAPFSVSRDC